MKNVNEDRKLADNIITGSVLQCSSLRNELPVGRRGTQVLKEHQKAHPQLGDACKLMDNFLKIKLGWKKFP